MKVVFRVDASIKIGTGHVMRCITLAEALKENVTSVEFICRKHKGNLIDKIRSYGFNVLELELPVSKEVDNKLHHSSWLGTTQLQDAEDCLSLLKRVKVDWLIVDHYGIDEEWHRKLSPYYKKLMVIDDLADRKYHCNILLDQNFGRKEKDYIKNTPDSCRLLLGPQYALIRPEFSKWREYSLRRRENTQFKTLLINMGGVDSNNLTEQVLRELENCNFLGNINITIVMGGLAPHLGRVKAIVNKFPYKTEMKIDIDNMAEIMANSDIAIGATGMTTWERCCLGLPTIQMAVAKNQTFSAEALANKNIIKLFSEAKDIVGFLDKSKDWAKIISKSSAEICDGVGLYKVFSNIAYYKATSKFIGDVELHNYINLNTEDNKLVVNMRNHPEIKKWMHNKNHISMEAHLNFINSLESDSSKRYFLVKSNNKVIGSINLSKINLYDSVEFGIYVNPFEYIKGAGYILEESASYYALHELGANKIELEVLGSNERAINFYKKQGFKINNTIKNNNNDLLCMEKRLIL